MLGLCLHSTCQLGVVAVRGNGGGGGGGAGGGERVIGQLWGNGVTVFSPIFMWGKNDGREFF